MTDMYLARTHLIVSLVHYFVYLIIVLFLDTVNRKGVKNEKL